MILELHCFLYLYSALKTTRIFLKVKLNLDILFFFIPKVFLGLPFDGQGPDNEAYIKLYTKSTAKVKKMVYDYTILSLLAEIGGYTGLLLGVSVLNLNNMVNKIIIKLQEKFRMK